MIIKDLIQKRKMTLFSWVISYIVILVFPIIISSFAYSASVKTVIDEVNRVHNESLMNFKLYMDKEISNIKRITSEISVDYKVKQLMTAEVPIPQAIMYKSVEIQKYLKELEMCNEGIDEIYIYFRKGNFILTPDNIYRGDRIPELYKEGLNLDDAEFEDLVNHARQFDCKLINEVPGNGADTKMAIFTKAIFSASRETPHAVIIITMNKEKLNLEIGNTDNWTGTVIVRNNRDEFISSAKKQLLPDFLYTSEMKDSASVFNVSYDNTQTIVNHIKSDFFNLEYICLVPSKAYLHKVNYVKSIIFAYIGFCLVVGVITAFLVARKNFRPVRRLSQMLVDNLGISAFESRNEFRFLEDSLRELLREKENAKGIISQQSEALRNNILKRVITGRFCKPISIMESLKLSGINLISDYFLVMIFSIKNLDDFFRDEDSDDDAFERVFFIIRNITEELVGEKHAGFVTEAGGMAVCLVNLSADQGKLPDEAKTMEEMLEIANRVDGLVSSILGVQLSIAVSGLQHSVRNIEKAYSQAVQVLEYKELTGFSESAADFSMIMPAKGRNEFITTHDKEKKFYNFVTAGDFLSAGSVLNDMITNDLTRSGNSLQLVKCRLFGILNSMINAIGEIRNSIDLEIFDELDPINRLLAAKSIVELKDEVNLIFSQINDCHKNKGDGQMYGKADEIVDYVRRNCFSPDLSISKIADVFQMSQPSVSRIFKKKTGNGLVEYIHELRVNKVKELMKSTDHSLKVIAGEVGFTNSVTLIRAFKKSEGIAPGKFRAIC